MCGACCIAISISSIIPALKRGKKAFERCPHLTSENRCELFGKPQRPKVCSEYLPEMLFCGNSFEEAIQILTKLS